MWRFRYRWVGGVRGVDVDEKAGLRKKGRERVARVGERRGTVTL
jgi:hypothetical protein